MTEAAEARITVRVQARGGKFLGDDIGGAVVTIRDAVTGELFATGTTAGGSGTISSTYAANASLSTIVTPGKTSTVQWLLATDTDSRKTTTSAFTATLFLDRPRLLAVEAFGPLGGLQSAHRVSATQWIVPGQDLTQPPGLVLLLPGLLVQVISPATHTAVPWSGSPATLAIVASVAMMCGCPINDQPTDNPWVPSDFDVSAQIREVGGPLLDTVTLAFNRTHTSGLFAGTYHMPSNHTANPIYYEAIVSARQKSTGNVGTGTVTFISNPAPSR
jgi:hypothetical protein